MASHWSIASIPAFARRRGRFVPSTRRTMRPASSSTFKCCETAGCVISKGSASSITVASPSARRARIARRVGSAKAEKAASSPSIISSLYNYLLIVKLNCRRGQGLALRRPRRLFAGAAVMERTLLPSSRQCRMEITTSCFTRTSSPKGFSCGSVNRFPHWWHLYRWTWLRPLSAFAVSVLQLWHVTVKSPIEFHSQKPHTEVVGLVWLRLCGSCPRWLCHPTTENTMGQQFRSNDLGLLVFCLHCFTSIIKK